MVQTILKPHNLDPEVQKDLVMTFLHMKEIENKENPSLEKLINCGYQEDPLPNCVLQLLANRYNYAKDFTIADCAIVNGRLRY